MLPAAGVLLLFVVDRLHWINLEHELFTQYGGGVYCGSVISLDSVGWLLGGFRLRATPVIADLGSIALLSLRQGIWD